MPGFDFEKSSFPLSLGSKQSDIWWHLDKITMKVNNIIKDIFMLFRYMGNYFDLLPKIYFFAYHKSWWGYFYTYLFSLFLVMGQSPSLARHRAEFLWRAQHFEKGPGSIQAWTWLFEKGPENWSFYGVKIIIPSRLGLDFFRRA